LAAERVSFRRNISPSINVKLILSYILKKKIQGIAKSVEGPAMPCIILFESMSILTMRQAGDDDEFT
jgi:hypothetical protein